MVFFTSIYLQRKKINVTTKVINTIKVADVKPSYLKFSLVIAYFEDRSSLVEKMYVLPNRALIIISNKKL